MKYMEHVTLKCINAFGINANQPVGVFSCWIQVKILLPRLTKDTQRENNQPHFPALSHFHLLNYTYKTLKENAQII